MAKTTVTESIERIPTADGGYSQNKSTTTTTEEAKQARKLNTQSGMTTRETIDQYYNAMKEPVNAQITQAGNDYQAALQRLQSMKEQADAENYRSYVRQQNELPGLMRASGNNGGMIDSAVASLANAYNQARAKRGLEYEANAASQGLDYNNRLAELRAKLAQYDQMAGADRAELDEYNAYLAEQERLAEEARQAEAARQAELARQREEAARQAEAAAAAAALTARRGTSSKAKEETKGTAIDASDEWAKRDISATTPTTSNLKPATKELSGKVAVSTGSGGSVVNSNDPTRLQNVVYEYEGTPTSSAKVLPVKSTPLVSESGGSVVNSNSNSYLRNEPAVYDKGTTSTPATKTTTKKKSGGANTSKSTGFTSKVLPSVKA